MKNPLKINKLASEMFSGSKPMSGNELKILSKTASRLISKTPTTLHMEEIEKTNETECQGGCSECACKKSEDLIPPGPYCYLLDYTQNDGEISFDNLPTVYCPYSTFKEFNGVSVSWCEFLNKGGLGNQTDEEFNKLMEIFGTEDDVFDQFPLDLLWDSCKECGMGGDYNFTEEHAIEWINKVKKLIKPDGKD